MKTVYTGLRWWEACLVLLAMVASGLSSDGRSSSGLICGLLAGICFGVWRCVQFLGQLTVLKQSEMGLDEESPEE